MTQTMYAHMNKILKNLKKKDVKKKKSSDQKCASGELWLQVSGGRFALAAPTPLQQNLGPQRPSPPLLHPGTLAATWCDCMRSCHHQSASK
jgi:hypothetical protein